MSLKKLFTYLLFSFLIYFTQLTLCEVQNESNEKEGKKVKTSGFVILVGVIIIIIFSSLLVLCYLIAYCISREGDNSIIFSVPWTLMNFVLDILFVVNQGKDVPSLYIPSLIFLIGPVCVNLGLSLMIMIKEKNNGSQEFKRWFYDHSSLAATATVFAGADMSLFKLLYSRIFRLKKFNAPFSDDTKTLILWGCVISSVIEDLPKLIIQILYKASMGEVYTLVPFLKLVGGSIKLPIGILGRVYEALKGHRKPDRDEPEKSEPEKSDESPKNGCFIKKIFNKC